MARAKAKLTAVQQRYKVNFDRKVTYRPVMRTGDFVFIDKPPRTLRPGPEQTIEDNLDRSRKLLPISEGPYRVQSATDTVVKVLQDGVTVSVSIDRVTKVPNDPAGVQPQGDDGPLPTQDTVYDRGDGDDHEETTWETDYGNGDGQDMRNTTWVEADDREFVIDKLVGHRRIPTGMQYRVRWYGYDPTEDTFEPAEHLPQPFIDRYWRAHSRSRAKTRRA